VIASDRLLRWLCWSLIVSVIVPVWAFLLARGASRLGQAA
jgi:hypothetical protein